MHSRHYPAELANPFSRQPLTNAIALALGPSHPWPLATAALCLGLGFSAPGAAATFLVSNLGDAGTGSLRQAVIDANTTPGPDEIRFNGLSGTIELTGDAITVSDSVSVVGPGSDMLTVDAMGNSRVFVVDKGELSVNGLTLTNGLEPSAAPGGAIGFGCERPSGDSDPWGLVLTDSRISGNAGSGVGFYCDADYTTGDALNVSIQRSSITGNSSGIDIAAYGGIDLTVEVIDSEISGNLGTAVQLDNAYNAVLTTRVEGSTIEDNDGDGIDVIGADFFLGYSSYFVTVADSTISGNSGAGIAVSGGYVADDSSVAIEGSTLSDNAIGLYASAAYDTTVSDSVISGNADVGVDLTGIYLVGYWSSYAELKSTTIADNGVGVSVEHGAALVDGSLITGNTVAGLRVDGPDPFLSGGGELFVLNSTVSGNLGPGIEVGTFYGYTALRLANSTVTGNQSSGPGGGLNLGSAYAYLYDGVIATMNNSVIAGNVGGSAPDIFGGPIEMSYSLVGDSSDADIVETVPGSNLLGRDPRLGPLQDNGGLTETHALLPDSPAINRGDPGFTGPLDFDQRGTPFARVADGRIDMGAFEVQDGDGPDGVTRVLAPGDINGDKVADIAAISPDGSVVIKDLKDRTVSRFSFTGVRRVQDVALLPDMNGNGASEVAALGVGSVLAEVRDTLTGERLNRVYFDASRSLIDLEVIADRDGNGISELANLAEESVKVLVKDAKTSARVKKVTFDGTFLPQDLAVYPDLNRNGAEDLSVLQENKNPNGSDKLEIRDVATGGWLKSIWLGGGWQVLQHEVIADNNWNRFAEAAVLRVKNHGDQVTVAVHDGNTGKALKTVWFDKNYPPTHLLTLGDVNGNRSDELVVFGQRFDGVDQKAQVKDSKTGKTIQEVWFSYHFPAEDISTSPDLNGNGSEELVLLGRNKWTGRLNAFIKDGKTGAWLGRVRY